MSNELDKNINFDKIVNMIETRRNKAYRKVNEELISLYWDFGKYISEESTNTQWGDKLVDKLVDFMKKNYPNMKGFNRRGLYRMKQFYETYKDNKIVSPLVTQLSWTNNIMILSSTKSMEEKENLLNIYKDKISSIEHIGSTSIKNIKSKPIIDIIIQTNDLDDFKKFTESNVEGETYTVKKELTMVKKFIQMDIKP